jgi:hypothetical protein
VDRASWSTWRQNRNVKELRVVNRLVKLGRSLALKLGDPQSMESAKVRARKCGLVIADAFEDAGGLAKSWLDSARLLGRIITILGNREIAAPDEYDDVSSSVSRPALELLVAVRDVLPIEVRATWCGQVRTLVSELATVADLSAKAERRALQLRPVAQHHQKLISDTLIVRGAQTARQSQRQNTLPNRTGCGSIDAVTSCQPKIPEKPTTSHGAVLEQLAETEREVQSTLTKLRTLFRHQVEQLAGASFGSMEEKKDCVQRLKRLAAAFRVEFYFDGVPVSLQVVPTRDYGVFRLIQKRKTVWTKATFPHLEVQDANSEKTAQTD